MTDTGKPIGKPIRLLLTGGGTGGHLFPAIAAAEELCGRIPDAKVMFIGTRRKLDRAGLLAYGYEVKGIFCYGLKGKNVLQLIKAVATLPLAFVQATMHILAFQPDIVVGVGGYVTGPVIAAAKMLGKKSLIHEQNSIPGLANRKLGRLADRVCISLPQSEDYFPRQKTILTGNPVRKALLELAAATGEKRGSTKKTVLVLGGSLGAHRLNELVVDALCRHRPTMPVRVIHQTGTADCEMVRLKYAENGIDARVEPFFRNMAEIYKEADLLISRAGATTLAELAVLGKPAILVPYPFAADNHQQKNAEYYVEGGGCRCFAEKELNGRLLAGQIEELLADDEQRNSMAARMKKMAVPQAASNIVDACLAVISRKL